ncbi:DUF2835 domain-containing protein [Granulosicoccaceae sp. 1_MG-2023]|nr:DUF2835 domain-containing protein [Granulosicoccaceae sp. 1_MG-2023]
MVQYEITLSLSSEKLLQIYRGAANSVVTRSRCGKVIRLPARHLLPFLDQTGVHGRFRLTLDADKRLTEIVRLS